MSKEGLFLRYFNSRKLKIDAIEFVPQPFWPKHNKAIIMTRAPKRVKEWAETLNLSVEAVNEEHGVVVVGY